MSSAWQRRSTREDEWVVVELKVGRAVREALTEGYPMDGYDPKTGMGNVACGAAWKRLAAIDGGTRHRWRRVIMRRVEAEAIMRRAPHLVRELTTRLDDDDRWEG